MEILFRFEHPDYLMALWLIPVFAALYFLYFRYKMKLLSRFAGKEMHSVLFGQKSFLREHIKFFMLLAAIAMLILAAANPQTGSKVEEVKQVGIDVYVCLDVSLSMNAEDLKPSRLTKAKNEIAALMRKLRGDRIGLIIFAGDAYIQFPLTGDYSAANLFLSAVDVNSVPYPGTAIAEALRLATDSFDYETPTSKVIVMITDGEDHEGDLQTAIETAREKDVLIYTIGMGTTSGAPIPVYNARGQQTGFKQDRQGNVVLSKLTEETLQYLAEAGGGKYYLASSYQSELDMIYEDLTNLDESEFGTRRITDYENKYYYFLIPALLILLIEFFVTERKSDFLTMLFKKM